MYNVHEGYKRTYIKLLTMITFREESREFEGVR